MKIFAAVSITMLLTAAGFAQAPSVWIDEHPAHEILALIDSGKTTLIYMGGATHSDGPAVSLGKHMQVGRRVAQRVAEELGNALVMPVNPYAPASAQLDHTSTWARIDGTVGGTISLSDETYALVSKDAVNSVLSGVRESRGYTGKGFNTVLIMGDHSQGQDTLQRVARDLDREWKPKGVRVYYIDVAGTGKKAMNDYLTKQNVPATIQTGIDDIAEFMSVDPDHKWVRQDKIPADMKKVVSVDLGKMLLEFKVTSALQQIRKLMATAN